MMITKQEAMALHIGQELHYTGEHECTRTVGPRGGVTVKITTVRVSGACVVWKTRPNEFRLPVKYGLYESGAIQHFNASDWHLPSDCPLAQEMRDANTAREAIERVDAQQESDDNPIDDETGQRLL